ncbi:hypothetical protein [Vibrio sp.]|uniref:hypothetical protein n=1 Tax=Vibrio sp. TaxID=678 RepID=UPI003D09B39F
MRLWLIPLCCLAINAFAHPIKSTDSSATIELDDKGSLIIESDSFKQPDTVTPPYYSSLGMRFVWIDCDGQKSRVLVSRLKESIDNKYQAFARQHCVKGSSKKVSISIGEQPLVFLVAQ